MAAIIGDDDFDSIDKPGAERSRRRRPTDDDWDSELEDDLLEEDYLPGKKTSDLSDEELNDDLLQSDEEPEANNYSSQGVTVSLNATTEGMSSFDLSQSLKEEQEESTAVEDFLQEPESEELYEEAEDLETPAEDFAEPYEDQYDLPIEQVEYPDDGTTDEVLELEIEPLDEFQEEEVNQAYKRQKVSEEQYVEDVMEEEAEDAPEEPEEQQDLTNNSEEAFVESQELPSDIKEESDDEDEEEDEGGRIRFKTERKEGTIIRLSDTNRERRNIPDTLELSAEAKASLMEFEEMERQRKLGRYGNRRGGRRGGNNAMSRNMGDQRHNQNDRRNQRDTRSNQGQPIQTLFQQQQHRIQPLMPMQRPQHLSSSGTPSQQEKSRSLSQHQQQSNQPHQPKNIHINPHFKGNVSSVQVPLLPVPNQPRPGMGPPRFPGMPDFQHGPVPGNFNPPPRLQEPWRNTPPPPPPPPQPEREPFFIGEPRFPNHHIFDQRNPPPIPPPPLLSNNLPVPNQNPPPFSPPGQGFNQPGPQPRFNQPQSNFNPPGPGPQSGFNPPRPQAGFNQPGFNQPGPQPGFNQSGPQPNFNPPAPQTGFNPPGSQPGFNPLSFNQQGPPPGFNQSTPQPPFNPPVNQPGFNQPNPGPQPGFNQPGTGPQPNFAQPVPGPHPGFPRERPVRMNLPSPGSLVIPPFSQPSANIRHFPPPRQQFPPGPGQPYMPHSPTNMQGPIQPPLQPLHHHPPGGQQKPPMPVLQTPPFRTHSQNSQNLSHRMPGPRHPPQKHRQNTPGQNMTKVHNQQVTHPRNSNLRELPIAPSHSVEMHKRKATSANAAHVIPVATTAPQPRAVSAQSAQAAKPANTTSTIKAEVKVEEQFPDEDEETRKYRLKIEEQKRLREEILKQKERRRQQQAGARKKELLQRLTQQQQASVAQQSQLETEKETVKLENSGSQTLPPVAAQARPNVKNRLVSKKSEASATTSPQKIPTLQTAVSCVTFQGQQKKVIKQTVQTKVSESPAPKVQQVRPEMSAPSVTPQHAVKAVPMQGKAPEQRLAGTKRTVMQRSNSSSGDGAHIAPKVRVIKLSTPVENNAVETAEGAPQHQVPQQRIPPQQRIQPQRIPPQQRIQPQQRIVSQQRLPMQQRVQMRQQQRPQMQQRMQMQQQDPQFQQQQRPQMQLQQQRPQQQQQRPQMQQQQQRPQMQQQQQRPQMQQQQQRPQMQQQRPQMQQQRSQQRMGPVRKVTLGKASVQQQQQLQQFQGKPRPVSTESTGPQTVTSVQGYHPANKVIMRGRGRGVGGQMGRGRLMPNKQNLRTMECPPQTCIVSVEGLSSSTTDNQLKNLLMSVGPVENLQMFPHQRKAIATFQDPNHALQFQQKFHRHMIDLSHINVSLVAE